MQSNISTDEIVICQLFTFLNRGFTSVLNTTGYTSDLTMVSYVMLELNRIHSKLCLELRVSKASVIQAGGPVRGKPRFSYDRDTGELTIRCCTAGLSTMNEIRAIGRILEVGSVEFARLVKYDCKIEMIDSVLCIKILPIYSPHYTREELLDMMWALGKMYNVDFY